MRIQRHNKVDHTSLAFKDTMSETAPLTKEFFFKTLAFVF